MSFFRYPGGKSKLKKRILTVLEQKFCSYPIYAYSEPFLGGGSIALEVLAKRNFNQVTLNDLDFPLSCLWNSIVCRPNYLQQKIRDFKPSVEAFFQIKEELLAAIPDSQDIVDIGFKKLAIHQLSFSGLGLKSGGPLGGINQQSNYKIDCRWSPDYLCKKIQSIYELLSTSNLAYNRVSFSDFETCLRSADERTLVYLDPPYYEKGEQLYQFAFQSTDHQRLAERLKNATFHWVLSYDDCQQIRELYSWAKIAELEINYSIAKATSKRELLITV